MVPPTGTAGAGAESARVWFAVSVEITAVLIPSTPAVTDCDTLPPSLRCTWY